ncbi:unnamed protein product [Camellia sinensis]
MAEFPALNGQSVSMAVLQFLVGGVNPPYTRPHSAKLPFVVEGSMEVGFVHTANKLYTQTLQLGDMFGLRLFCDSIGRTELEVTINLPLPMNSRAEVMISN